MARAVRGRPPGRPQGGLLAEPSFRAFRLRRADAQQGTGGVVPWVSRGGLPGDRETSARIRHVVLVRLRDPLPRQLRAVGTSGIYIQLSWAGTLAARAVRAWSVAVSTCCPALLRVRWFIVNAALTRAWSHIFQRKCMRCLVIRLDTSWHDLNCLESFASAEQLLHGVSSEGGSGAPTWRLNSFFHGERHRHYSANAGRQR